MTKAKKKVVKTTTKKKKIVEKEVIATPVQEEQPRQSKLSKVKSIFDKILKFGLAPTVLVALIGVAPQMLDKIVAWSNNMTYEDYILSTKQLSYWEEYADCINKDPVVITNGKDEIKLRMCDKTLIMTEFQSVVRGKSVYSWLNLDVKSINERKTSSSIIIEELYAQQVKPRFANDGVNAKVERQLEKLMCKKIVENKIIYYIKTRTGCIEKSIDKMTGQTNITSINCEKICKN